MLHIVTSYGIFLENPDTTVTQVKGEGLEAGVKIQVLFPVWHYHNHRKPKRTIIILALVHEFVKATGNINTKIEVPVCNINKLGN